MPLISFFANIAFLYTQNNEKTDPIAVLIISTRWQSTPIKAHSDELSNSDSCSQIIIRLVLFSPSDFMAAIVI